MPGVALQDIQNDLAPIGAQAAERLGYIQRKSRKLFLNE
jgi:hypothetical protein